MVRDILMVSTTATCAGAPWRGGECLLMARSAITVEQLTCVRHACHLASLQAPVRRYSVRRGRTQLCPDDRHCIRHYGECRANWRAISDATRPPRPTRACHTRLRPLSEREELLIRLNYPLGLALESDRKSSLTALFQRLNRVIPEDQRLETLPPETSVRRALAVMKQKGFSQMSVSDGLEVLGVFSYRSFSLSALRFEDDRTDVMALSVADCLEELPFWSLNDPFEDVIADLDRFDAILIGTPENTVAIISAMDVLRYLYGVTSPFVVVAEIELAIRALMTCSASSAQLQECFKRSISKLYEAEQLPATVDELTFGDYASVLGYGDNWEQYFKHTFGSTRSDVHAKLDAVSGIRNHLFHFRREISGEEFEELTLVRDWLLRRSKMMQNKQAASKLEVA
jgi:CBS domain-containing protein